MPNFSWPKATVRVSAMVAAVALSLVSFGGAPVQAATAGREPLKVMPLGDSITNGNGWQGPNAYRGPLWDLAERADVPIDFVGTQTNDQDTMADTDQEGYNGIQIQELDAKIEDILRANQPDVILLHIGTNNIWREGELPTVAPERLSKLIDHITTVAPRARLYVASIVPSVEHEKNVLLYNEEIPSMVKQKAAQGKRVSFVNIHDELDFDDLVDGIHPNARGYKLMAKAWWSAMKPRHENH